MIQINGYPIDIAVKEAPSFEADITELPVEKGADTTDHIRAKPMRLEFEGWVSDTPIGAIASDPTRQTQPAPAGQTAPKISKDAYDKLVAFWVARQPFTVICSFGTFTSMGFETFKPERSPQTGNALHFTGTFKQVNIVENQRTTVRVAIPSGGPKQNLGLTPAQKAALKGLADNFPINVICYPTQWRVSMSKKLGAPLYTRRGAATTFRFPQGQELDCYQINGTANADGYLLLNRDRTTGNAVTNGDRYTYFPYSMAPSQITQQLSSSTGTQDDNGQPVHYDYGSQSWKGPDGQPVTKDPPADPNAFRNIVRGSG